MNKLKEAIKYLVLLLFFIGISIFLEIICFNHKLLFLDDSEKIIEINDYKEEIVDDIKKISFDLNNSYVDKLKITYVAERDVNFTLNYQDEDYYGNLEDNTINDVFDNEVSESVNNFRSKVSKVEILCDSNSSIEIDSIIIENELDLNVFRIFFITITLVLGYILYKFYKKEGNIDNIHRYFVLVGLLLGITIIILQPSTTYYSWDDQIHFSNTYEIFDANGNWDVGEVAMIDATPVGRRSISAIEEQMNMNDYLNIDEPGNYVSFKSRFITYNKIAYLPSAIGFHLCKIINLPFVVCFKVGKIMNLLAYLLIFGYAIKITKTLKRFLVVLGLVPTNLFLATQYSYDPAVISGITLGIVLFYNMITNKDNKVDFKFMVLFLFLLGQKIAYLNEIIRGVEALRTHKMDFTMRLEGNNELTELAESINFLSFTQRELQLQEKQIQEERENLIRELSHDIRTPLTSILSYSEYMMKKGQKEQIEQMEIVNYISMMQQKSEQIKKHEIKKQYLAIVENYPNLKADTQYMSLQSELKEIEDELERARHKYNDEVTEYNTVIESVPSNIVASIFAFKHAELFQIEEHKKENVKINL